MKYQLSPPSHIDAAIDLPASKSISSRALILGALAESAYSIEHISDSDDTKVLQKALSSTAETVDIGAAGTAMRFLTAYFAVMPGARTLTGSERMKKRPIKLLVDALQELGASIRYEGEAGFPPLFIEGKPLEGGAVKIDGSISSQYISALLMIAPKLKNGLFIEITGALASTPYVAMTLQLMKAFGVEARWVGNTIAIPSQTYTGTPFFVEGDWSAASYWYEIAALHPGAQIELKGLFRNSCQGDAKVAGLFEQLGVSSRFTDKGVLLTGGRPKVGCFEYDFIDQPDLAQAVAVTCALLKIPFRFKGVQSLKIKETDRIEALRTELGKLGYRLDESDGRTLVWRGEYATPAQNATIATYDDHRMAMAFAPACIATGTITIEDPAVVSKSYPSFWEDMESAGFKIMQTDR